MLSVNPAVSLKAPPAVTVGPASCPWEYMSFAGGPHSDLWTKEFGTHFAVSRIPGTLSTPEPLKYQSFV